MRYGSARSGEGTTGETAGSVSDQPMDRAEWAAWMTRLWFDGPKGPACADVVRRFVAGEIEVTCREVSVEVE